MSWGAGLYIRRLISQANWPDVRRGDVNSVPERWLLAGLGMVLCYLGGTLLSTLLGIDLMIRNERYWLVLTPFVALFAASGITDTGSFAGKYLNKKEAVRKSIFARAFIPLIALCFFLQAIATILLYSWAPYLKFRSNLEIDAGDLQLLERIHARPGVSNVIRRVSRDEIIVEDHSSAAERGQAYTTAINNSNEDLDKLYMWPQIQAMKYLRDHVPSSCNSAYAEAGGYVLLRQAHDQLPGSASSAPLSREGRVGGMAVPAGVGDRVSACARILYLPTLYNSILQEIISRPISCDAVFFGGRQPDFCPMSNRQQSRGESSYLTPGKLPWTKVTSLTGGRKALGSFGEIKPTVVMNNKLHRTWAPLFQRDWSTTWISGIGAGTNHL